MVSKSAIISLVFIIIGIVFTIIAYSSYWYKSEYKTNDDNYTIYRYKYDKFKTEVTSILGDYDYTTEWNNGDKDAEKYEVVKTFQASLAFISLAFIVLVVAAVLVLLQSLKLLKKIPCLGGLLSILGKFILIAGTVFCFLSMFIFLNLPKAQKNDCEKGLFFPFPGPLNLGCDDYKFTYKNDDFNYTYGPDIGWVATVIASAATLVATIINIFGGIF